MHDQELGAKCQRPLDLATKRGDRLGMELGVAPAQIDKIVRMDDERLQVVALAPFIHLVALRPPKFVRRPLPRAGGENLEGVAAEAVGAFGSILYSSGA